MTAIAVLYTSRQCPDHPNLVAYPEDPTVQDEDVFHRLRSQTNPTCILAIERNVLDIHHSRIIPTASRDWHD